MEINSKTEAQRRADQIGCFQAELKVLEHENIISLPDDQRTSIEDYHNSILSHLLSTFDIDANTREKQLSWGMKIASFLGALGFAAGVFFLFYQFWGRFSIMYQVLILVMAPIMSLVVTSVAFKRDRSGYIAKLLGMLTVTCFILNIVMLGQIFNINPSENDSLSGRCLHLSWHISAIHAFF